MVASIEITVLVCPSKVKTKPSKHYNIGKCLITSHEINFQVKRLQKLAKIGCERSSQHLTVSHYLRAWLSKNWMASWKIHDQNWMQISSPKSTLEKKTVQTLSQRSQRGKFSVSKGRWHLRTWIVVLFLFSFMTYRLGKFPKLNASGEYFSD